LDYINVRQIWGGALNPSFLLLLLLLLMSWFGGSQKLITATTKI
jgi:hypothetical protein